MKSDRQTVQIGQLAASISETHPMREERLVFLNTSDILYGKILHHDYTAVKDWPGQAKKSVRRGDILFSEIRPANGRWAFVEEDAEDFVVSTKLMVIRPQSSRIHPRFLYQFLTSSETTRWLQHLAESRSGTFPQITFDQISTLEIPLPPLPEQKRIADILGSLDDKIELNRKMNETLEAMARALFKSWFVDFDPVVAKSEGRQPVGMDAETAKLFPAAFEDSEIGRIPKGWKVEVADNISKIGIGKTPPRKEHQWFSTFSSDIPWMSIRDLGNAWAYISHTAEFLTQEAVERFRVKRIPDGTVVLSFKLTVGRVAITDGEMLSNEAIAHFILKERSSIGTTYLYCYLKAFDYEQLGSTSSIATAVNSDMVRQVPIVTPPKELAHIFEKLVTPFFTQIKTFNRQTTVLTETRDALLPRLLSGELAVATD